MAAGGQRRWIRGDERPPARFLAGVPARVVLAGALAVLSSAGAALGAALGGWTVGLAGTAALGGCETHPIDAVGLAPTTLRNDLLAHYTFDEGTGTAVLDHSGNRHDGVLTGGTWIADGVFGGALHFSAGDDVRVPSFPNAPSSFSVSAWLRTPGGAFDGYQTLLSTEIVFDGGWQLNVQADASVSSSHFAFWNPDIKDYTFLVVPVPVNRWTHVVSVVDGAAHTLSLYVDGQSAGVVPADHAIVPGTPDLLFGTWSGGGRLLVGDVDDVAIYGRALVPAEIVELGNHPAPDPI